MNPAQGLDSDVSLIPIPSALPERPDLGQLPADILRSSTVESLINQNDDLMARLSVSLRRNSKLEEELSHFEKQKRISNHQIEILNEKLSLTQAKEARSLGRDKILEDQIFKLKDQLKLSETKYFELYNIQKDRAKNLIERIEQHGRRLNRFIKYKSKIKKAVLNLKRERTGLATQAQKFELALSSQDVRVNSLQARLDEMGNYIQTQGRKSLSEKAELVQTYEIRQKDLFSELENEREARQAANNKLEHYEKVLNENLHLQSESNRLTQTLDALSLDLKEIKAQLIATQFQLRSQKEESETLQVSEKMLLENKTRQQEQIESLQVLWSETQKQVELKSARLESLQRLNQSLSISLNQFRKENDSLKNQSEKIKLMTKERLRSLKTEVSQSKIEPEVYQRIEVLLSELNDKTLTLL